MLLTGFIAERRLAPRSNRSRTSDWRFSLAAAVRMIAWVHNGTADCRSDTQMTCSSGFTEIYVFMAILLTCPIVALQLIGTFLSSPEGSLTSAYLPSLAMS